MSDDQLLEDLVARGQALAGDHTLLSATIERLTVKNQQLQDDLQSVSRALQDAQLQFEAELLDRDLRTTQVETELAALQLNVARTPDSSAQVRELQNAVSELTIWHADVQAKLSVAEKALGVKTKLLDKRNATLKEVASILSETKALCDVLEDSQKLSDELIKTFEQLHANLEADNGQLKREKQELQDALSQAIAIMTNERLAMKEQLSKSERAKESLELRIKQMEPQLLPKWEKEMREMKASKVVSTGTHQLARDFADLGELAESQRNAVVTSLADTELSKSTFAFLSVYADIIRLAFLSKALCRFLVTEHLSEWIAEAEVNPQAMRKNKLLIAWTHQTLKDLGDFSFNAGELLRWARGGDIKGEIVLEMEEIGGGEETLSESIRAGVTCLVTIVKSFLNFTMSTALTTQALATTSQRIVAFLKSKGHDFPSLKSNPAESSSVSVPVMTLLLSAYLATVVCGLASASDRASESKLWEKLVQSYNKTLEIFVPRLEHALFIEFKREGSSINLSVLSETSPKCQCIPLLKAIKRLEEVLGIADKSEVWSMANLADLDTGYRVGETLNADCLAAVDASLDECIAAHQLSTQSKLVILSVEIKSRLEGISRVATLKSSVEKPSTPDGIMSDALTTKETANLVTLLEAKLQSYQLREEAFAKAEDTRARITAELQKLRKTNGSISNKANLLEKRLNESQRSLRELQTTLQEMQSAQEAQSLIPPSVASFELLKAKAVLNRMQTSLIRLTTERAEEDWSVVHSLLDKDSKVVKAGPSLHLAEVLALREAAVGLALRNPALELLNSAKVKKGRKLAVQDLLKAQSEMKANLFHLARKWHKMNLDATDLVKNEQKTAGLIRDTSELTLVARKKAACHQKIVVDPSKLAETLSSMIISL